VGAAAGARPEQARAGGARAGRRGALPGAARRRPQGNRRLDRASALAGVLDACACYALRRPGLAPTAGPAHADSDARTAYPAITAGRAELAARLLGAAHAVRGAFDESSLDAPQARAAARDTLGPAAFDAAYRSAADSTYQTALELAHAALIWPLE
jgi:hypothetical protein